MDQQKQNDEQALRGDLPIDAQKVISYYEQLFSELGIMTIQHAMKNNNRPSLLAEGMLNGIIRVFVAINSMRDSSDFSEKDELNAVREVASKFETAYYIHKQDYEKTKNEVDAILDDAVKQDDVVQ